MYCLYHLVGKSAFTHFVVVHCKILCLENSDLSFVVNQNATPNVGIVILSIKLRELCFRYVCFHDSVPLLSMYIHVAVTFSSVAIDYM